MADHDHSESIAKPGKLGLDLKATTSDSPSTFKPTTSNIQRKGSSTAFGKLFHNELFHDQVINLLLHQSFMNYNYCHFNQNQQHKLLP